MGQFIVNWRISLATHLNRIPEIGRMGERSVRIREVEGSNPFVSTNVCQTCF